MVVKQNIGFEYGKVPFVKFVSHWLFNCIVNYFISSDEVTNRDPRLIENLNNGDEIIVLIKVHELLLKQQKIQESTRAKQKLEYYISIFVPK